MYISHVQTLGKEKYNNMTGKIRIRVAATTDQFGVKCINGKYNFQ
jgi:hypothetical protein